MKASFIALVEISWERINPAEISFDGHWIFSQSRTMSLRTGRPHGNRHGKTEEQRQHHIAHNLRKRCIKRGFEGIHDRFQNDSTFRESLLSIDRTEEVCIQMDKDAQKDFTYRMTEDEYFRCKKNWWISLNTSGKNEPMKLRSDFNEALTKLHRLHRESGEERLAPITSWQYQKLHPSSSSSTTSWWQWNDSWWSSWKIKQKSSTSELVKEQHTERWDPLCSFFTKLLRSDTSQVFFFCSQIVYSWQQSAATDGVCEQHTSHVTFS